MVKNEDDIIESFVRYNLNILDEMIILDNGSTDNTLKILNFLKSENLPIDVLIDEDRYYNQDEKMTRLLYLAFYEYDADIVCVLDADEFISSDNQNPREILESIDLNKYYQVKCRTYVPTMNDNYSIDFIPSRINHIRDEKFDRLYKVIVPKESIKNGNVSLKMGNHDLSNINIQPDRSLDLNIAHFPLRSKEQTMSKILVGWPNMISKYRQNNKYGVHWKLLFEKIMENGFIDDDDFMLFSKNYALSEFEDGIEIHEKTMNTDFCNDIEIRYTYHYNYLSNILENYLYYVNENILLNGEKASLTKNLDESKKLINTFSGLNENFDETIHDMSSDSSIDFRIIPYAAHDEKKDSYLISVIVPVFNGERYLSECLDSIVNQTLGIDKIELILVDDYSSDNSVNIIKEYISRYPSIKLYQHSNNLGVSSSRNTGLKYATADFITFLDCDDYISPNAFLRALEIFNHDEEIDLLIYKWEEFNENGLLNLNNVTKNLLKEEKVITNINDYPELIFATYAYIKVYSKRLVDYLEFPQILFEDNIVSARVMVNSNKIFIVDDITVYYRQHGNQITSEYSANKYLNVLASSKQIIDLREDYFEYYDVLSFLALRLLYHCIWYLTKYDGFSIKDGELVFHALKEFPKYFSHEIFVKYQNLFPNFLPCSEQTLWDIETMDFYEYVLKYRYQNEIKRLNDENSSLNNKITDFETSDSRLRDNISDLEKRNAELINKNTNLKKRIDQYKSRKIVRFVDKIKRAI